jgi:hypothetical protein
VRGNACTSSAVPNSVCKHPDATFQIGCLSQANLPAIAASAGQVAEPARNCSVGFAGFSAVDGDTDGPGPAHADAFALASIDPTKPNVQNGSYPFTRKLFLSSLVKYTTQFPGITPGGYGTSSSHAKAYENLARCYADSAKVYVPAGTSPLEAAGFIPLPGGKPLLCANMCSTNTACTQLDNPF